MAGLDEAAANSFTVNDVHVVDADTRLVDGVEDFDTLDLGGYRAVSGSIWNAIGASGGRYQLTDPATGASFSLDYRNIEAVVGSPYADQLVGNGQVTALFGGAGDDVLVAAMDSPNASLLRGGEGADSISGGDVSDDINGNQGDDTVLGWDGDDTLHGGKGDDVVLGGAGNDALDGDLGDDTLTGGAGADTFRVAANGGVDRITDFSPAEGDRVQVEGGESYALDQSGADTIITLQGGGVVVLAGVALEGLPSGWIVGV